MADQLYLSLWYPNFRLESLPAALAGVLRQFALIARDGDPKGGSGRVAVATTYPINWTESPTYQRIYPVGEGVNEERAGHSPGTEGAVIENAVAEATGQLHLDMAYEFEMYWLLWQPQTESGRWAQQPWRVKITGFGPEFDEGSYEQNGHIRVDFGLDTPWVPEDGPANEFARKMAAKHIQQNVERLLAFTLSVEKHCGISGRLLWTESGEPLAEKLIARLQRLN